MDKFLKVISRIWLFPSRVLGALCAPIVSLVTSRTKYKVTIPEAFEAYRLQEQSDKGLSFLTAIPANCLVLSFFPSLGFPLIFLTLINTSKTFFGGVRRFCMYKYTYKASVKREEDSDAI